MEFQLAQHYTRQEIHDAVGGNVEQYLPTKDGRVVCGAFRPDANPDAPMIVLAGQSPRIRQAAEQFAKQTETVPIFLKREPNRWQYVGRFRVQRSSTDAADIACQEKRASRHGKISMVLFLEREASAQPAS
jgi:hypothetical protein